MFLRFIFVETKSKKMNKNQENQLIEEIKNLSIAVENLYEAVKDISYHLKGDGGHTIGDSLEAIMFKHLEEKK